MPTSPQELISKQEWPSSWTQWFFCFHELVSYLSCCLTRPVPAASQLHFTLTLSLWEQTLAARSCLCTVRMDIKQNSINSSWKICMSICLSEHTNTQPACPLLPQHCQHHLAEATNLAAILGWRGEVTTLLWQKKMKNSREHTVIHGTRLLGRRKPETVWSKKKRKTGESRTPDSRERTKTMVVIKGGGEIVQVSYTLTSFSKLENWTVRFVLRKTPQH